MIWFAFGYSMCFGPTWHGIVGDPTYYAFLRGITLQTMYTGNDAGLPLVVHVAYQMMFAIITPALITGAFTNRVSFKAYFLFQHDRPTLIGMDAGGIARLLFVRSFGQADGRAVGTGALLNGLIKTYAAHR